ncbi:putative integral membrane protein (TIGR00698 family) [Diaminobutyricimonas aerilata]|uniref:Putative integral membrane protein (TIGR00698 family) n=2 Tax=Diaminobutyricimonas aerilata TaxID=1162967 RepID=A0A2M9CHL9_9MICO|nr:putative integral membrane protein (TIGR00698 family) [Diaminobutyricimonas aerilata]
MTATRVLPGIVVCAAAALAAWALATAVPAVPLLTAAVALGILVGQLPLPAALRPGLGFSSRRLMRIGVVLLGLKLSLGDIAELGWAAILGAVAVVVLTFVITWALGRLLRLPGDQPLLIAAGFSICGASAIGAMSGALRANDRDAATPVALVTLCGTLAIAVLPPLQHPLGLDAEQFGHWVGAGVHDVGQVVATAQIAGPAALAIALVIKLTRVIMLAPMVAVAAAVERRRGEGDGPRPPIVPLFVVGFVAAVLIRSFLPVPDEVLHGADLLQTALLAMALFALGTAVRVRELVTTGWRALVVGLGSWIVVALLALAAVRLS